MSVASLFEPLPDGTASGAPDETQMQDTPSALSLDRGMPAEIMNDFDTVLLYGRLAAIRPSELTVRRIPGEPAFSVCEPGSTVLVRGYDNQMEPVLFRGRVFQSSGMVCMVKDLQAIPYQTQRRLIRYPLCPPADVYMLDGGVQRRLQLSQMLNISAGGACVVSECAYDMGQPLCLRIKFTRDGPYSVYQCRVVRITPRRGGFFEYGLLFTHMDKSARDGLLMNLHTIQENTEKKLLP